MNTKDQEGKQTSSQTKRKWNQSNTFCKAKKFSQGQQCTYTRDELSASW